MDRNQRKLASIACILLAVAIQRLSPFLLPHGPAVEISPLHRPVISEVDPSNESLRLKGGRLTKIYERMEDGRREHGPLLFHPETILFDNGGIMYIMNEGAKLVSLTDFRPKDDDDDEHILTARTTEVAHLGPGRPLGGKFDSRNCLYYASVMLGLARLCDPASPTSKVELLASRVRSDDGSWSPILYADDVDIGPRTGHVYFSDASDVPSDLDGTGNLDFHYSSKIEGARGKRSGRLLRYRPETGEADVLATGVAFANGVAVDEDETYVLYTSTFEARVMRYHLQGPRAGVRGPRAGISTRLPLEFPGFLDGVDCSFERRGVCYVAVATTVPPLARALFAIPGRLGTMVRTMTMVIPRNWTPKPEPYGGVAEIQLGDDGKATAIVRMFQDPDGRDASMVTGVTEFGGKLYLGSLHNDYVGVLSLD